MYMFVIFYITDICFFLLQTIFLLFFCAPLQTFFQLSNYLLRAFEQKIFGMYNEFANNKSTSEPKEIHCLIKQIVLYY